MKYFVEIDSQTIKNSVILLDIDGTLKPDGAALATGVREKVEELNQINEIYLCTNKKNHPINRNLAANLGVKYLESNWRKPNPRLISYLELKKRPLVIIGDKFLTDGLLAYFVDAQFIWVKRLRSFNEGRSKRFSYWLDNWLGRFLSWLMM